MPVVPYEPVVREQGLPNVRFDPSTPNLTGLASAQIEGGTAIAKAAGGVLDSFLKFAEEEKKKGDQLAVLDADKQLGDLETQLLHGPAGALNKRGKDAFGTPDEVSKAWNKQTAEIEKNLANNDQRAAFTKARASRQQDVNSQLQRHVSSETRKYDDEVTTSFVNNERNAAGTNYLDNERINQSINRQGGALLDYANRNGKSQEWVYEKMLDASSKTHMLVIGRMLANGEDQFAESYYKNSGQGMTSDDRKDIEKALEQGRTLGQAQRIALDLSSRIPNMTLAQAEIDKMSLSPKTQKMAEDLTRERYNLRDREEEKAKNNVYEEMAFSLHQSTQEGALYEYQKIQQDPRYVDLDNKHHKGLEAEYRFKAKGTDPITNQGTWYELNRMASHPELRSKFLKTNLLEYRNDLSNSDFQELANLQSKIMLGDEKTLMHLDGIRSKNEIVNSFLSEMSIDTTPLPGSEDSKSVRLFREAVDQEINLVQQKTGKQVTNEDVSDIVKRLGVEGYVSGSGVLGFMKDKKRVYQAATGETLEITIDAIPKKDRAQIENELRLTGRPVTEENIIAVYGKKWMTRGR